MRQPARFTEAVDLVAMLIAILAAALLLLGARAAGAATGAAALTILAVGSWARTRHTKAELDEVARERDELRRQLDRLSPLAATGLASAGLAHEMKNALMVTHGYAQLASRSAAREGASSAVAHHLRTVEDQALALATRLTSFVRLAAPDPTPEVRPLPEVLDELVALVGPLARYRELSFEHDVQAAPARPVNDPDLRAALLDLLLNALDHAATTVWLRVETNDGLKLVVQDDGPGVPLAMRSTLFEPFVTARPGGLGLGLHRAKRAAENDAGTLDYEEAPQGGARFVLALSESTSPPGHERVEAARAS